MSDKSRSRSSSIETSRGRSKRKSRRYRSRSRSRHHRSRRNERDSSMKQVLSTIIARLNAVEENTASTSRTPPPREDPSTPRNNSESVHTFADALFAITRGKQQDYYVSNFDPAFHDFEVWCDEVERAKSANHWGELECLSRVANCLKGDARVWLNEWTTNDRSWSSFRREFKSLCPHRINRANILFEVMATTSDRFPSYAEYARRSLLRLRIVKGLSEDLMTEIVIRGINDAQIRAAAMNANLTVDSLVSFLSIYVKPNFNAKIENRGPYRPPRAL